ncbi:hypothetical protein AB0F72_40390 [Actinoplanes sp. NPDC023936]|uniref:hypothetical protein n=1 Tax=Actinoplanes sp. NPDC023936 TaxID=3154910 RepID=UPI0033DE77C4
MNPLLLGGEMPHWSDRSPAGGDALTVLASAARGHTLIVGPHAFPLIDAVPSARVTVLTRGVPDAEALAARYASRPGFEVCCGSLEKLAAVPAYDTVLALDGLDRAGSTESDGLTWADSLGTLLAVLRPGGRLMLGCANPAGLHRLLALPAEPGDEEWGAPAFDDASRPVGAGALRSALAAAGLDVLGDYAAYPDPRSPRALVGSAALRDPDLRGFLAGVVRRAGAPDEPMLADPRPVAVQMLASDLAGELAPGWFVVAARGGSVPLPDVILAATPDVVRLTRTARGWCRSDLDSAAVPVGRNLMDALLVAARARDLPGMRALLTAWQGGEFAGVSADGIVVDADGRLHDLRLGAAGDPQVALGHFVDAAPADLAELIAAMTGVAPASAPAWPGAGAFREVAAERDRLARELGEAQARLDWYESRLATRDAELARAHRIITLLKGTVPGRAATAVRGALRTGKRAARTALHQFRRQQR